MASAQKFDFNIPKEKETKKTNSTWIYIGLGIVIILILSFAAYNRLGITSSVTADLEKNGAQTNEAGNTDQGTNAQARTEGQDSELPVIPTPLTSNGVNGAQPQTPIQQKNEKSSDAIKLVIELHDHYTKKDTVKISEAVTKLDRIISVLGSSSVKEAWDTLALCLARSCSDNNFLDFMNTVAIEGAKTGMRNAQLIVDLITTNKYWGTDNTVRLSEAITAVDKEVKVQNQPSLMQSWQAIVTCDGKCSEKTQLIFNFLSVLS